MTNEEKIIDYLSNEMSFDEKIDFEQKISVDDQLKIVVEDYKAVFEGMDKVKLEKPSQGLKSQFDQLLESETSKLSSEGKVLSFRRWRNVAAVAAVLVIGILVGQNWTQRSFIENQTSALVSEMKQNMNSESVTGRIEAVQVSHQISSPEDEVLHTLIKTLKNDVSPNVRLAAAEALTEHASSDLVRTAFVSQLSSEKDPFVLIALINTLSDEKVEKAIDPLQELTTAENVAKFIKDEAHLGLIRIEKI